MNATTKNIAKIFKLVFEGAEDDSLSREYAAIVLA